MQSKSICPLWLYHLNVPAMYMLCSKYKKSCHFLFHNHDSCESLHYRNTIQNVWCAIIGWVLSIAYLIQRLEQAW